MWCENFSTLCVCACVHVWWVGGVVCMCQCVCYTERGTCTLWQHNKIFCPHTWPSVGVCDYLFSIMERNEIKSF